MRPAGAAEGQDRGRAVEALPCATAATSFTPRHRAVSARRGAGARLSSASGRRGRRSPRRFRCRGHWPSRPALRAGRRGWRAREGLAPRHSAPGIVERFGMREVQAAAPGQQELAGGRCHVVMNGDVVASLRQDFRRHQPRRARTDYLDLCHCAHSRPEAFCRDGGSLQGVSPCGVDRPATRG